MIKDYITETYDVYDMGICKIYDELEAIVNNGEFGCFSYADTEKLRSLVNTLGDMIA